MFNRNLYNSNFMNENSRKLYSAILSRLDTASVEQFQSQGEQSTSTAVSLDEKILPVVYNTAIKNDSDYDENVSYK